MLYLQLGTKSAESGRSTFYFISKNVTMREINRRLYYRLLMFSVLLELQGGYVVISGLCLPKSLKPLLPVFLQVFFISFFSSTNANLN